MHYAFDLFEYHCAQAEPTGIAEGERLNRYALQPKDIVVADRAYGTVASMEYARQAGADFLLRLRSKALTLYDEAGERIDPMPGLRALKVWEPLSVNCFYKDNKGVSHPVRIVATRKDDASAQRAGHKLARTVARKSWGTVAPKTQEMTEYIVLATSLADGADQVLELYRARWQTEGSFQLRRTARDEPKFGESMVLRQAAGCRPMRGDGQGAVFFPHTPQCQP